MRVLARLGHGYASASGFPFLWLWAAISSPLLGPPSAQQGAFAVVIYDANAVREALTGLGQSSPRTAQSPVAQLREEGDAENSTLLEIVDAEERKQYVLSTLFQEPAYRYSIAPEDPTLMQRVLHLWNEHRLVTERAALLASSPGAGSSSSAAAGVAGGDEDASAGAEPTSKPIVFNPPARGGGSTTASSHPTTNCSSASAAADADEQLVLEGGTSTGAFGSPASSSDSLLSPSSKRSKHDQAAAASSSAASAATASPTTTQLSSTNLNFGFLPDNVQEVILGDFVASDKADPYGGAESEAMRAAFTELLAEVGKWHRFGLERSCAKKQQKFVADLWGRVQEKVWPERSGGASSSTQSNGNAASSARSTSRSSSGEQISGDPRNGFLTGLVDLESGHGGGGPDNSRAPMNQNNTTGTGGAAGPPLLPLHLRDAHMKGTKTKTRSYSTPAQMNVWRFGPRGVYFPVVAVVPRIKYNGAEPPSAPQTQHLTAPRSTTLSSSIDYRCFGPEWQDKVVVAEPDFENCHAFDWNGDNDPRALFCCAEEASAGLDIWADSSFFDPQEAGTRSGNGNTILGPLAALTLIGSQLQEAATTARGNEPGSVRRANMFDPSLRPFPGIYYHAAARSQTPERRAPPAGPGRHTSSSAPRAQTGERPEGVSSRAAATSSSRKSRSRASVEMNEEEERPISGTRMRWQDVVHYIGKKLQFPALPPKTKLNLASRVDDIFPFQSYHPQHREGCPVPRYFPTALTVQVPYQS